MNTFSIRNGIIEKPPQLVREVLQPITRNRLASSFQEAIIRSSKSTGVAGYYVLSDDWLALCKGLHVNFFIQRPSQFDRDRSVWIENLENFILRRNWNEVLDLLEVVIGSNIVRQDFIDSLGSAFKSSGSAYRLINGRMETITSEEHASSLDVAINTVSSSEYGGAKNHLQNASTEMRNGKWKSSIRESISSIESILFDATGQKSFAKAIDTLKPKLGTHSALVEGWKKIYGYTSDKDGIRHAMLSETSSVDEKEAIYMYGACAGFVAYLTSLLAK